MWTKNFWENKTILLSSCGPAGNRVGNTKGGGEEQPQQQPCVWLQYPNMMMMDYLMLREAENYQYCDENYKDQQRNVNIVLRRQTIIFNKGLTYLIWKYFREHWANDNENSEEKQSININVNCEIISLSPQSLTKEEERPQHLHPVRSKWAKSLLFWNWTYCWVTDQWQYKCKTGKWHMCLCTGGLTCPHLFRLRSRGLKCWRSPCLW